MTREAALKAWETMRKQEAEMSNEEREALYERRRKTRRKAEATRKWRKLMNVRIRTLKARKGVA